MIRSVSLLAILLLSACSTVPTRARHDLIGLPRADLIACAGVPDNRELLPDGEVLEWRQDQQVEGPLNIKTPISLELDIGGRGSVSQIEYTGPSTTLTGPYAACRPLVLACERWISHK